MKRVLQHCSSPLCVSSTQQTASMKLKLRKVEKKASWFNIQLGDWHRQRDNFRTNSRLTSIKIICEWLSEVFGAQKKDQKRYGLDHSVSFFNSLIDCLINVFDKELWLSQGIFNSVHIWVVYISHHFEFLQKKSIDEHLSSWTRLSFEWFSNFLQRQSAN